MKDNYTVLFVLGGVCIVIVIIIGVFYMISPNNTINDKKKKTGYLDLLVSVSTILLPLAAILIFIGVKRRETQTANTIVLREINKTKDDFKVPLAKRVTAVALNNRNNSYSSNTAFANPFSNRIQFIALQYTFTSHDPSKSPPGGFISIVSLIELARDAFIEPVGW